MGKNKTVTNIKVEIKEDSKNSDCIVITFLKPKKTDPDNIKWSKYGESPSIPKSAIPYLIRALEQQMQPKCVQTDDDKYKKLTDQLVVYRQQGKKIEDYYSKCINSYSAFNRNLQLIRNLETYLSELKEYYEKIKKLEEAYNSEVGDYMPVFNTIMEDLACFAGCTSDDLFDPLSSSIYNRKRHMSYFISKKRALLDAMGDLAPLPDIREPLLNEKTTDVEYPCPEKYSDIKRKIKELLDETKDDDCPSPTALPDICAKWETYTNAIKETNKYFFSVAKYYNEQIQEIKNKKDNLELDRDRYLREAERKRKDIFSHDKERCYYRLLQLVYPLVKEICSEEDDMAPEKAVSFRNRAWEVLECFNRENREYRFRWVTHNDEDCLQSEYIRVDFIADEACWPGLYLYSPQNPEKLICVTPGHIATI